MYKAYLLIMDLASSSISFLLNEPYDAAKIGRTIEPYNTPSLSAAMFNNVVMERMRIEL